MRLPGLPRFNFHRSSIPCISIVNANGRSKRGCMVAQECTSTLHPQRDRSCTTFCLRTTPVVFPHRFPAASPQSFRIDPAVFPHSYYSVVFPHCFRGISAVLWHCSRGITALLPQSFHCPFSQESQYNYIAERSYYV